LGGQWSRRVPREKPGVQLLEVEWLPNEEWGFTGLQARQPSSFSIDSDHDKKGEGEGPALTLQNQDDEHQFTWPMPSAGRILLI